MQEIMKKRVNRYVQFISIFYAFFIFILDCATSSLSSVSDADLRVIVKSGITVIAYISFASLLKEVIGAILEFRQEREIPNKKAT